MKNNKLKLKFVVVIALVAVLFLGVMNVSYFNKRVTITPSVQTGGVVDGAGTELVSGKIYSLPSNMVFSSVSRFSFNANDGITVAATVKPDTLENKAVSWSLSWQNPNSTFAKGKNVIDYVTLIPDMSNNTANIKCIQGFSEKIILTATSTFDTSKSATCVIDYANRVTGIKLAMSYADSTGVKKDVYLSLDNDLDIVWECDLLSNNTFFGGFSFVRSDVGTILPDTYDLSYDFNIVGNYYDIIDDYINSLTILDNKTVDGVEVWSIEEVEYELGPNFVYQGNGNLFDNICFVGWDDDGNFVYESFSEHRALLDSLVDYYKEFDGNIPICQLDVLYSDDYSTCQVENINIFLGGQALNFYSVSVSLDNSGVVL